VKRLQEISGDSRAELRQALAALGNYGLLERGRGVWLTDRGLAAVALVLCPEGSRRTSWQARQMARGVAAAREPVPGRALPGEDADGAARTEDQDSVDVVEDQDQSDPAREPAADPIEGPT
jgi:hypothetical protein